MDKINNLDKKVDDFIEDIKIKVKSNKSSQESIILKLKELKNTFKNRFNLLIDAIDKIEIKELTEVEEEVSPASICSKIIPSFTDGTHIYTHEVDGHKTLTCLELMPSNFETKIKVNECTVGYVVLGVSNAVLNEARGYLGGEMGNGNWGIASNGSLGEKGTWKSGKSYKSGDIVTIKGEDGIITYAVNDEWDTSYSCDMNTTELYIAASLYYKGNQIEIID